MEMLKKMSASMREEVKDLLRGMAGGLIFGTPLMFTMEMWFHGMHISPEHLLGIMMFTGIVNVCFSYASGLRHHNKNHTIAGATADAITSMALGIIISSCILALIGQLNSGDTWDILLAKIIIEACAISLGITFTNAKFPCENKKEKNYKELEDAALTAEQKQARLDFQNMAAVIGGALIFSFNVAPTEEVVLIASSHSDLSLLILVLSQIIICYIILYAADFKERKVFKKTIMQSHFAEIIVTVVFSWMVSAVMIALIGKSAAMETADIYLACVITLGFPALIGGAAGKAII